MQVRFAPSAIRFLDRQPHNVRSKLVNDAVWLNDHPYFEPDDASKRPFLAAPVIIRQFQDGFHWILYYIDGDSLIIANIGLRSEPPHLRRPPDG